MKRLPNCRIALTLVEVLVTLAVIGIVVGAFLIPGTRGAREAARRMSCSGQLKQIGLALHNYHSTHKFLPPLAGGTEANRYRLSGLVALTPFLQQQHLWEQLTGELAIGSVVYPPMGPHTFDPNYTPWQTQIATYQCPSTPTENGQFGTTNYAFSIGDTARMLHDKSKPGRGMFHFGIRRQFKNVQDGLSHTIAMCEIPHAKSKEVRGQFAILQSAELLDSPSLSNSAIDSESTLYYAKEVRLGEFGRGGVWADGAAGHSMVNTILPPNGPSCLIGSGAASDGILSAGSFHQGGGHVLMGDGAVIFMTDSVDAGDSSLPTYDQTAKDIVPTSPYGLWGALGTIGSAEQIEEQLNQ